MEPGWGILLATGKRRGLLGSKTQRAHLSEAVCPGLKLLVSALEVGGRWVGDMSCLQPSVRGLWGGGRREGNPSQAGICEWERGCK